VAPNSTVRWGIRNRRRAVEAVFESVTTRQYPSLIGFIKAWKRKIGRRSNRVIYNKSKLDGESCECDSAISKAFRRRDSVGRFQARSFTVDAGTSSSLSLGRSAGLSSNVKHIYRKVGQPPSHGTSFLALLGKFKSEFVGASVFVVERGVSKVHRRKEEISTRNFDYELGRGTWRRAELDIDYHRCVNDSFTVIQHPR